MENKKILLKKVLILPEGFLNGVEVFYAVSVVF